MEYRDIFQIITLIFQNWTVAPEEWNLSVSVSLIWRHEQSVLVGHSEHSDKRAALKQVVEAKLP
jgi:hypothetical protein